MDIWLVNPYGPIPGEGWRDYRFTLVGRALAKRGHNVRWWTAAFAHQTKEFRSHDWASHSAGERFTIELVPTPSYSRNVGAGRLWFELMFSRRVFDRAKRLDRPDLIIAADPPQFCGAAGRRLAGHFDAPLLIDCLDLWPELFVKAAPALARPFVRIAALPLFRLRRRNVDAADLVIAVAETYRRAITGSSSVRSTTIPIGVDVRALAVVSERDSKRIRVIYAGSLGEAYDLDTVLEAASMLRHEGIDFVIAGRGPAEERLRNRIGSSGLTNVTMVGHVSEAELPRLYGAADIALAPYIASSTVALPLKLFDYLAAGLPVVTSLSGEALQVLETAGAGLQYRAGDAASLTAVVRLLAGDREKLKAMAIAARAAADQFDSAALYERYAAAVESVVDSRSFSPAAAEENVPKADEGAESIEVRPMIRRDLADVVAVHEAAFPNFFLSTLGRGFLGEFYGSLVDWPEGVAIVAVIGDRIVGFAAGSTVSKAFYRRLFVRRSIAIGLRLLPVFLRKPATLFRVMRRAVQRTGSGSEPNGAELMSIAVAPGEQHHGIGRTLLDGFVARIAEAQQQSLWLTTDAVDNEGVKRFYEMAGFAKSRTFTTAEGRRLDEYRREL